MRHIQYFFSILLLVKLALHSAAAERSRHSWISRIFGREKHPSTSDAFTILDETPMYSGWRTIVKRRVRMRNGKVVDFDLVGVKNGGNGVLIFAWNTQTKTATLVREYMPGSHRMLYGLAAGLVEEKHGGDVATAACHELEEEAHLTGGTWVQLSKRPSAMDKYSLTSVDAYLVLDPVLKENPKPLDDEEDIEIVEGVTITEIKDWISTGDMNVVSAWGCMLAIEKLRELGEYP